MKPPGKGQTRARTKSHALNLRCRGCARTDGPEVGNENLWYVLADANGLQGDDALVAGSLLGAPGSKKWGNNTIAFKPYNTNEIRGSTPLRFPFITTTNETLDPLRQATISTIAALLSTAIVGPNEHLFARAF